MTVEDHGPGDQSRIWSHFQNAGADSFEGAKARLDYLLRVINRLVMDPRVLTIGVGDGYLENRIRAQGWDLVALDPDTSAVERLREWGIDARCGVMEKIPCNDEEFDCVVASEVIEHLTDVQGRLALLEVARVLRPGGVFIGTVPYAEDLRSAETVCPGCGLVFHRWGHKRSFDAVALRDHLAPLFVDVSVRRRVFVDFARRPLRGKVKGGIRWLLGMLGERIAAPNLLFVGRRGNGRPRQSPPEHDSASIRS